jgi:hypothetical protein
MHVKKDGSVENTKLCLSCAYFAEIEYSVNYDRRIDLFCGLRCNCRTQRSDRLYGRSSGMGERIRPVHICRM